MNASERDEFRRLHAKVDKLEADLAEVRSQRDQILGMGKLARFGMQILFAFGATGLIATIYKITQWLNGPLRPH